MKDVIGWILNRMKEKSSWLGIIGLVTAAVGTQLSPGLQEAVTTLGLAVVGLIALVLREKGSSDNTAPPSA